MLIKPRPYQDESFQSYIIRLCRVNGLCYANFSKYMQKKVASLKISQLKFRKLIVEHVSLICGYIELQELVDIYSYKTNVNKVFNFTKIKICMKCYLENKKILNYWYFKYFFVCPKHEALLTEHCCKCKTMFTEDTFILNKCTGCDMPLNKLNVVNVKADKYSKMIYEGFNSVNFKTFNENIDLVYSIHNEIQMLNSILNYFCYQRKINGRIFDVNNTIRFYHQQLGCSYLSDNKDELYFCILHIVNRYVQYNESKSVRKIFNFLNRGLNLIGSKVIKDVLRELILSKEDVLYSYKIDQNWLEILFDIDKTKLNGVIFGNTKIYYSKIRYSDINTPLLF